MHLQKLIILLVLDVALWGTTDARSVSSLVLMLGFLLLLATTYYLLYELLALARFYGTAFKHQQRLALSLTGVIGCLVALQSVGELSPRDAAVLVPIGLLAYFYSSYGAKKRDQLL